MDTACGVSGARRSQASLGQVGRELCDSIHHLAYVPSHLQTHGTIATVYLLQIWNSWAALALVLPKSGKQLP